MPSCCGISAPSLLKIQQHLPFYIAGDMVAFCKTAAAAAFVVLAGVPSLLHALAAWLMFLAARTTLAALCATRGDARCWLVVVGVCGAVWLGLCWRRCGRLLIALWQRPESPVRIAVL